MPLIFAPNVSRISAEPPGTSTAAVPGLSHVSAERQASPSSDGAPVNTTTLLAIAWLLGLGAVLVRIVLGLRRLSSRLVGARELTTPEILNLLAEARRRLRITRPIQLLESDHFASPSLVGLFRPKLLLPKGLAENLSAKDLQMVFLHELAHVKRGDILLNWIVTLLQAIHWFNPVIWFAFARLRADRELACDALALTAVGEEQRGAYGQAIIRVLENIGRVPALPGTVGILEDCRQLKERMQMISRFRFTSRWWLAAAVPLLILGGVFLTDAQAPSASERIGQTAPPQAPRPAPITFKVVDAAQKPLPNAMVLAVYRYEDDNERLQLATSADGSVQIPESKRDFAVCRGLTVWSIVRGYVPRVVEWNRYSIPAGYTLTLSPAITVTGRVVNARSEPVSNVEVRLAYAANGNEWQLDKVAFHPKHNVVRTDQNGAWAFPFLPPDLKEVQFVLTHPDYAVTFVTTTGEKVQSSDNRFVLDRGNSVLGTVVDPEGRPVKAAVVREIHNFGYRRHGSTVTDENGRFALNGLPKGATFLIVQVDGFAPALQNFQLEGDQTAVEFRLNKGKRLAGRVVDTSGAPIPNATVGTASDNQGLDPFEVKFQTDANGHFEWNAAPDQILLCYVTAPGYGYQYGLHLGPGEHEIKFTQARRGERLITGSVTDAQTGQPVNDFVVVLGENRHPEIPAEYNYFAGTSGQNGRFTLSVPLPNFFEQYVIRVAAEHYQAEVSPRINLSAGDQDLKFTLHPGRNLEGFLMAPEGLRPLQGAEVYLCAGNENVYLDKPTEPRDAGGQQPKVVTGLDGSFHFATRPNAETIVVVHRDGYLEIPVTDLQKTNLFTLEPYATVEGTLYIRGKRMAGEHVGLSAFHYPWGSGSGRAYPALELYFDTTTDAEGHFKFEKVPPGERQIYHVPGFRQGKRGPIPQTQKSFLSIKPGEALTVDLGNGERARQITGKLQIVGADEPIDWLNDVQRITSSFPGHEAPDEKNFPNRETFFAALQDFSKNEQSFWQSEAGHALERTRREYVAVISGNGDFVINDALPGRYRFDINVTKPREKGAPPGGDLFNRSQIARTNFVITIPGETTTPFDLGLIRVPVPPARKPQAAVDH